jgi:hypothetical protein
VDNFRDRDCEVSKPGIAFFWLVKKRNEAHFFERSLNVTVTARFRIKTKDLL